MEEKKHSIIRRGKPGDRRIWIGLGQPGDPELQNLIIFFGTKPTKSEQPTPPKEGTSPQEEFLKRLKSEMKFPVNVQGKAALDDRNKD